MYTLLAAALLVLVMVPLVGHLCGRWLSEGLRVPPGRIGARMPTIPDHTVETQERAERRWERRVRRAERRLLERFEGGVSGAEAGELAAVLGEDRQVVDAALARMREETACGLRITRSGRMLHDFDAAAIEELRERRSGSWLSRAGWFGVGLVANLGAAWPVILSALVAAGTLAAMAVDTTFSALAIGWAGLGVFTALVAVNALAGGLTHLVLRPLGGGPRLGDTREVEEPHQRERDWLIESFYEGDMLERAGIEIDLPTSERRTERRWVDWIVIPDIDDPRGCLLAIAVLLLLAVLAVATLTILVWMRGIWRAVRRLGEEIRDRAPARWIRGTHPVDNLERYLPTNDLVLRVVRVIRRELDDHAHHDADLVARILALAAERGGRVSALDIVLHEAIELEEAAAIGARLTGSSGGALEVTEDGELVFAFEPRILAAVDARPDPDLGAEYVQFSTETGMPRRREAQHLDRLPINLPGLSYGHVLGTNRLVVGTAMMCLAFVGLAVPLALSATLTAIAIVAASLATAAVVALAGTARHIARESARQGVRRDARRYAVFAVRRALARAEDSVDLTEMAEAFASTFEASYPDLEREVVLDELESVCEDLDLGFDHEAMARSAGSLHVEVGSLGARLDALERYRDEAGSPRDVLSEDPAFEELERREGVRLDFGEGVEEPPADIDEGDEVIFEIEARERARA